MTPSRLPQMLNEKREKAQEDAQQVKTSAAKPDNLSLIPGTHKVEGEENRLL